MRKKRLLVYAILLIAWLFVPWAVNATVFVNEEFEADLSATDGIPEGWDNSIGEFGTTVYKWTQDNAGYEGKGMKFNSYVNSNLNTNVLLTPSFVPGAKTSLEFWFKNPKGGDFSVYITADNGNTFIDTLESGLSATEWTMRTYQLGDYATVQGGVRVAFYSTSNCGYGDAYHYLDNVVIQDPPLCAQPIGLTVSELTQTSAKLMWQLGAADANPDKYELVVTRTSDGVKVIENPNMTTADLTTSLTNLTADTKYMVTLTSDCRYCSKGTAKSDRFEFTTLIDPVGLPYEQAFDTETNDIPHGIMTTGNVSMSTTKHGTSGKSVQLQSTTDNLAMIVFPQVNHAADDMQFTAYVYGSKDVVYSVGLMSDPIDASTFFPLRDDTIQVSSTWTEIRLNSADYGTQDLGLSFAVKLASGKSMSLNMDDVSIVVTPTCPRPEKLKATGADSTSVRLAWQGKAGVIEHQVRLETSTDTTNRKVTSNPVVLQELLPQTSYTVRVRDICAAGDTSEWSHPVQFKTMCGVRSGVIFSEGFESGVMPECWIQMQTQKGTGSGTDYLNDLMKVKKTYPYRGQYSAEIPYTQVGTRTALVLQPIRIDQANKYDLTFWMKRYSGSGYVGEGINVWVNNTPDTVGATKCMFVSGSNQNSPAEPSAGWYQYTANIERDGVVYIIFEVHPTNA